ncbi:hypothetical protein ASE02_17900 [Phenylobacterium sp. Root700]|nr:hypothetical protein ASE02_17900 [Phenylobacterium sp. Root700]
MIVDVEATTAVRQVEVGAVRTMIERVRARHDLRPAQLAADTAYGSAEMLDWLVNKRQIAPQIPVIDKSGRDDGTFARRDFIHDPAADTYRCPTGKTLKRNRRAFRTPRPNAPPDDTCSACRDAPGGR